jgi:hypothetical protein
MHAQRVRRYGDPNYVTSEENRRMANRFAQLQNKAAEPHVYRKAYGKHEHRRVAEQMLGRPLVKGEIVHHIDGDRHNNSHTNLQVMTQSEHMKLHFAEMMAVRKVKHGY